MYTLETGDLSQIVPNKPPSSSKFVESVDWRIPSNDPSDNTIDPNLKPMRSRLFDMGLEHSISPTLVASARYAHRTLDRTIEDTGTLGPQGEKYFIANPGFGLTADPKTWGPGFPVTPKAVRDYDAVELRLDKRFSRSYQFAASYTWSRLWGNYGGLASSDENGRVSPNVNRYFDLPFMSYDERGQGVYGRLASDRPHTFKVFANYALNSKLGTTNFAPYFAVFSGTPLTTEVSMVSSVPIFVYGRGDLGRTPVLSQTDLNVYHDFKPVRNHEQMRVRVEATCFNCFNQSAVTGKYVGYNHANDGQVNIDNQADFFKGFNTKALIQAQGLRVDPRFNMANAYQGPRTMRFQMMFFF